MPWLALWSMCGRVGRWAGGRTLLLPRNAKQKYVFPAETSVAARTCSTSLPAAPSLMGAVLANSHNYFVNPQCHTFASRSLEGKVID